MENLCNCREWKLAWAAMTDYKCNECHNIFTHWNTAVPKYCRSCANKLIVCNQCWKDVQPIPIYEGLGIWLNNEYCVITNIDNKNDNVTVRIMWKQKFYNEIIKRKVFIEKYLSNDYLSNIYY